jgi:L,D-peptidoglycan transpeptidase YkuD (ErfK/YbiS/YcfS/YnhG family)
MSNPRGADPDFRESPASPATVEVVALGAGFAATVSFEGRSWPGVLGRAGAVVDKREGDGGTPVALMGVRRVWVRPEVVRRVVTVVAPVVLINPQDVWCDDVGSPWYNRAVTREQVGGASHELLWRSDHLYDVIVELDFNMCPVVPGRGSGIFLHVARGLVDPRVSATSGCIAMLLDDLLELLAMLPPASFVRVSAAVTP